MAGKRLYTLDESIFQNVDTEEKAYWLGFIYADGSITTKRNTTVSIKLNEKDFKHLEKIKNLFGTDRPVKTYTSITPYGKVTSCQLTISSKKIVEDLIKLGCVPRKSLILQFPTEEQVPAKLVSHFVRGYFDGDGSVFLANVKKSCGEYKYLGINVCGTKEFLDQLSLLVFDKIQCIYKEKRCTTNTWNFKLAGNKRSKKLLEYLYENSTIYMERKKEIYDNYLRKD